MSSSEVVRKMLMGLLAWYERLGPHKVPIHMYLGPIEKLNWTDDILARPSYEYQKSPISLN